MVRGKNESSLYKDAKGYWTAVVELPPVDGKRRRKVVRSRDKLTAAEKLDDLRLHLRQYGDISTRSMKLEDWLNEWFETVVVTTVRPKTSNNYRYLIRKYIIPAIGQVRLDKLTAAHVRRMNYSVTEQGLSSTTALQVYRILSVALKAAEREGHVHRNVATLVDAPRKARTQLRALTATEGIEVLKTALGDPLESLYFAILLTGARQGELLGLEIDRVSDVLDISWQLQRLTWQHGCSGTCGRKFGSACPQKRIQAPADYESRHLTGGLWLSRPKSNSGWRMIPLVEPLATSMLTHINECPYPNPHGLVWRKPDGSPIDPKLEAQVWHELLERAGVPDVRLHDGRHTTVDLLYEAGVPEDLIQEIVGHSSRAMSRAYKSRGNSKRLTAAMHQLSAMFLPSESGRPGLEV